MIDKMIEELILQDILEYLNSIYLKDRHAVQQLMCYKVPCNEILANCEFCAVSDELEVSPLGVLHGLVKKITGENLMAVISVHSDEILEFATIEQFQNNE